MEREERGTDPVFRSHSDATPSKTPSMAFEDVELGLLSWGVMYSGKGGGIMGFIMGCGLAGLSWWRSAGAPCSDMTDCT